MEGPICRVCFDEGDSQPGGALLSPCRCRGSMAHVHERCLREWLCTGQVSLNCSVCKGTYRLPASLRKELRAHPTYSRILRQAEATASAEKRHVQAMLLLGAFVVGGLVGAVWSTRCSARLAAEQQRALRQRLRERLKEHLRLLGGQLPADLLELREQLPLLQQQSDQQLSELRQLASQRKELQSTAQQLSRQLHWLQRATPWAQLGSGQVHSEQADLEKVQQQLQEVQQAMAAAVPGFHRVALKRVLAERRLAALEGWEAATGRRTAEAQPPAEGSRKQQQQHPRWRQQQQRRQRRGGASARDMVGWAQGAAAAVAAQLERTLPREVVQAAQGAAAGAGSLAQAFLRSVGR